MNPSTLELYHQIRMFIYMACNNNKVLMKNHERLCTLLYDVHVSDLILCYQMKFQSLQENFETLVNSILRADMDNNAIEQVTNPYPRFSLFSIHALACQYVRSIHFLFGVSPSSLFPAIVTVGRDGLCMLTKPVRLYNQNKSQTKDVRVNDLLIYYARQCISSNYIIEKDMILQ